jgi:hypothetical protein
VSDRDIVSELECFKGKRVIDCIDEIESAAHPQGYYVNVIDPQFNTGSIDSDPQRLNVRANRDFVITSFTIG